MKKELKKVLLIDDDEDLHVLMEICLRDLPHLKLHSAYSGEEGIQTAMEFEPDIILLDVLMPQMDGIGTLEAIKLIPTISHIPVIFLTARAQKDEIESYLKKGVFDVIVKPFDPNTLSSDLLAIWKKYTEQLSEGHK